MPKDGYAGSGPHRCADAEAAYTRALAILDPGPGRETPVVTESLNNLAELYRIQGRNALAEPLYRRTLVILEKSVGPQHQRVGITLNNLAEVHGTQGRWEDAGRFYPQAIAIVEKNLDPDHPTVAGLLENYAVVLRRARRDAEAIEIDGRARDICARHALQNPRR
jgi:tetratricopeptide (TPR) repeat protein